MAACLAPFLHQQKAHNAPALLNPSTPEVVEFASTGVLELAWRGGGGGHGGRILHSLCGLDHDCLVGEGGQQQQRSTLAGV